ncbi:ISAs1 family transposase, partial [Porphyromonas gulae]
CQLIGQYIRGHWGIENRLHWHLDVTFREDACRTRKDYSATNLNTLRKFALAIVSGHKDKLSLRKRLFKAALNIDYLTLRKFALAIVSGHKDKLSLRKRLFKAALNIDYLKKLLKI